MNIYFDYRERHSYCCCNTIRSVSVTETELDELRGYQSDIDLYQYNNTVVVDGDDSAYLSNGLHKKLSTLFTDSEPYLPMSDDFEVKFIFLN